MSHHHAHSDNGSHGHAHGPVSNHRVFAIGVSLNLLFVITEWLFGIYANSLSLIADAVHNFGDVLGLLLAWAATRLAQKEPNHKFTYGLKGSTILAALLNAASLLLVTGGLSWEALQRLHESNPIEESTVMIVASVGIVINGFTAWLFMDGGKTDLNMRGAYLHLAADAAISAAVVVGAGLMMVTGWAVIDPLLTLLVSAVIVVGTWQMFTQALAMALQAVPPSIDMQQVQLFLNGLDGVQQVQDVHIWSVSTTETAITAHLVMPSGHPGDDFLHQLSEELLHQFNIHHSTFQIRLTGSASACAFSSDSH